MDKIELRNEAREIFAVISKEAGSEWIYVQWVGYIDEVMLKRGIKQLSKIIAEQECPYLLSDRRIAEGNWFKINNWLQHKWGPKATRAGLQYLAHVTAPLATSQMSSQDLESRLLGFQFKSFESLEQAEDWLREIIKQKS